MNGTDGSDVPGQGAGRQRPAGGRDLIASTCDRAVQAQADNPAERAQDRARRALRGQLTRFIADTMMGGSDEVKDGSWPVGARPLVLQRISADLKADFSRVLSMKVGAQLAITLPETRCHRY